MAVDAFIKIPGAAGESAVKGFADQIDVLAWSWGMSQSGTTHLGKGGGAGKVNVQDLSFTHYLDASSPALIKFCCGGKHFDKVELTLRKAGDKPLNYLKIELTDVMITSLSTGGSKGEERLTENVTLNFAKFKYVYTVQKKDGGADKEVEVEYNIAENA
jgi:type VI secretion system secreted protein Hcp